MGFFFGLSIQPSTTCLLKSKVYMLTGYILLQKKPNHCWAVQGGGLLQ